MSIEAYKAVWSIKTNGFTSNLRCTLLALAEFASQYNDYTCSASVATIAEMLDTRPRQAQRNLADLERLGLIKVVPNRGRGNTNIYDLKPVMRDLKPVIDDTFYDEKTRHAGQENTSPMTPIDGEKVSYKAEKVSSVTIKPVTDDTRTVYNRLEPKDNDIYIPPLPDDMVKMIEALRKATKTKYGAGFNEDMFEKAAAMLLRDGVTIEQVESFPEYWKTLGWGGARGLPTLEKVVEEMDNCINRVDTRPAALRANGSSKNGNHPQPALTYDPLMPKPGQGGIY